ncbi:MAG: ubiquinone/menaquinone biosynthesis C-methylase UbiE [Crocinitomicaceae bacterium]|jgi:ubiquinone/menaquinone biosynthesis C-methylase UbiE
MSELNKKAHWETIYQTKALTDVSWYEQKPTTSLDFIDKLGVSKTAKIIDVGGGDSFLVDHLLNLGYTNLTVLDISGAALQRAKDRLGERAEMVNWIEANAVDFTSESTFDLWHDRAAFHFLTEPEEIERYIQTLTKSISPDGKVVIGTFSEDGPKKCSGIEIQQYSKASLGAKLLPHFENIECLTLDHSTPFGTTQNFVFCSFRKVTVLD